MAQPASLLSPPAPGGEEEEAEDASPRLLPRSSPTPRPRPFDEEAAPRGEASGERRVRFADTLGLPLVAVQCYDSRCCTEFPGLPLLETQRHGSMCCSETIGYPLVAAQGHGSLCCNEACGLPLVEAECCARLCPAQSPDPAQELGALGHSEQGLQSFYLCPTFLLPACPQQLEQRVQSSGVELESLLPCPTDARALRGVLRVLNISYRKSVYVRATFDRWASFYDHPADYLAPCDDGRTDQFAFRLAFAPPYTHDGARLEFVARYETPDQIFWANNGGRNYGVVLKATGSTPVAPPFKPVFWELEHRRLKSCLKPLKNRSAEEVSGAPNIPNTFLPAGLAIGQDGVPQLLKPTPLHPERPSNQVPTLLVTSTSPEKFHSYRPMTFAESALEHATKKGGYVITPPESLMGLQNPCEEEEDVHCPRRDKSTWIGDLNTLRHAGSRFANGEEDTIRIGKDITREKSLLERPIDRPAAGRSKLPSYIPPTSEDSDNEDAVEKELEQLYLSHLSRLQAAKELKEPGEEEAAKGMSKEPCPGPGWHAPVSPLDFTSSKRVLNTWLVEEISLRHANGRDQEELIDVAQEDVELPSSSGESSPLHPEGQSVQNEISSSGQAEESTDNPSAREVEQATPNKESSEVMERSALMNLPSIPPGGILSTEEHAKLSALGPRHNEPSYSPLVLPDVKAADFGMSSLSYESCPVTRDNTTNVPCRPASTPLMVHSSTDARVKILPETEEDRIFEDFQLESEDFFQGNALDVLSRNSDRHREIKQQKESILQRGELSAIETSRNQQEIVKRSEESSRLGMSRNLIENVLLKEDLSGLKNSSNLQERVLLSEELSGPAVSQNLQEEVLVRENISGREASQELQEIVLLKEELTGLESSLNVKGNCELREGHSALEIPRHEQEHVKVSEAFSGQKTSQNLQEIILLSGELFGMETAQNLQDNILLSEELCGQEASHNLQEIVLLSEELSGVEPSENLLESTLQIEELCEMGAPQSLQEAVLLDGEHSELEISQNLKEMFLLKEETFELESSHILPLSGDGCWNGSTLSAPIHEGLEYLKSSTAPLGQGCKYRNASTIPLGESVEYTRSCTTPLDAWLEHSNSFSSLLSEGLEYSDFLTPPMDKGLEELESYSAQLDEGFSYPHSSSALLLMKRHDKDPNLILNAAVTQSLCVVCALLFLLVMLQGGTAFVAVLLYLMSVWFL
ncbi:protein phosphatase 1 regulatory subunit 3F [Ambystoma mexicanum]|uniref:protein phosphatase 1 regulatory subunit 3F n=1 Tax=Ambystoma mexicanum TaxID=8296 RepID=UPI0037E88EAA